MLRPLTLLRGEDGGPVSDCGGARASQQFAHSFVSARFAFLPMVTPHALPSGIRKSLRQYLHPSLCDWLSSSRPLQSHIFLEALWKHLSHAEKSPDWQRP